MSDPGHEGRRVHLQAVPIGGELPFPPDAVVREEDTCLVLSAGREPTPPAEPTPALLRRALDFTPHPPGSVVIRAGSPPELLAVVHDLEREPTWRREWITAALQEVMRRVEREAIGCLALPILGAVHGNASPYAFLEALRGALRPSPPTALGRLLIRFPPDVDPRDVRALELLWREGPERSGAGPR